MSPRKPSPKKPPNNQSQQFSIFQLAIKTLQSQ